MIARMSNTYCAPENKQLGSEQDYFLSEIWVLWTGKNIKQVFTEQYVTFHFKVERY